MEEEKALAVFERKMLQKIYGPVKESELWGTRQNDEFEAIIKGENIFRFIKCKNKMACAYRKNSRHPIPKKMLYGKLCATRRRRRIRRRWLDNVSMDRRKMGVNEFRDRARIRETCRRTVQEVKAHPALLCYQEEDLGK